MNAQFVTTLLASMTLVTSISHAADKTGNGSAESSRPPKQFGIPLGHPDFYPSSERPIGWRGDWTGAWPGARCVTYWDAETGENIAWKVNTPGAGFSQPLVVGEKVFVTCEPNLLMCYSVHTGEELWRTAIDHTTKMDTETARKAREEIKYFDDLKLRWGRWGTECEDLNLSIEKAGFDMKAIWQGKSHGRVLRKPEATGDLAKILADAKIKALWERLYSEQEEYALSYTGSDHGQVWTKEIHERASKANRLYDIWPEGRWDGFCPSWPTPCSDGERIYVATYNNAVAAVNLDGTIAWMVWDHLGDENGERRSDWGMGMGTRYASSPVLYGNYFYVDNDSHVRVYDKRTGEKLWEYIVPYGVRSRAPLPKERIDADWTAILRESSSRTGKQRPRHGGRPSHEACSPAVVEVPLPDGSLMPVVHDGMCFLYRLADGKVLSADMPFANCSSVVRSGNTVMAKWNEQGGYMVRITARDRETLDYTWLHYWYGRGARDDIPLSPVPKGFNGFRGTDTGIAHDGWWYGSPEYGYRASIEDGRIESWGGVRMGGNPSPILVGTRIYSFGEPALYERGAFNFRKSVVGVAGAASTDIDSGAAYPIERSHIDRRLAEDSDYALRYAYARPGQQGGNASPCAQANRIFHRTKGVLYCFGDPGDPFPAPKDCPSAGRVPPPEFLVVAGKIASVSDEKELAGYLDHAHPAVRAAAARKVSEFSVQVSGNTGKDDTPGLKPEPRTLKPLLQRLAREDLSAAVRGAAILALGAKPDQPGGAILCEQIAAAGEAGPWQHTKPPLQRVIHTLRVLGAAAEPTILSVLQGEAGKSRDAALACVLWQEVPQTDAVREVLLSMLDERSSAGTAAQALAVWPKDPKVTARFTELLNDPKQSALHVAAFSRLLPLQAPDQRTAFLESLVAGSSREARSQAVAALVADGDVERIRPILAKATGQVPGEIASALAQSCAEHPDPNIVKAAVSMIMDHLKQPDKVCQAAMVGAIQQFFADAAPALPSLRSLDTGGDAKLQETIKRAIEVIEMKAKGVKK